MDSVPGDQWIAEYARWLRIHEAKLGDVAASTAAAARRGAAKTGQSAAPTSLSSTFWNVVSLGTANTATANAGPPSATASVLAARPMLLLQNPHNLYYLLIRFEELGFSIGSLDTKIPIAARPTSYFSFIAATGTQKDKDNTMSMSSMQSRISVVSSSFSSSLSWFGSSSKPDPSRDVKYIYSCFTKIPNLRLGPIPARKLIQDFEDCPGQSAVPLDVFKNLQMLELDDVDPRTLIGWDRVCIQLRSLTCKKSGIEDLTDLLVDLILVDTKRRRGEKVDLKRLRRTAPATDSQENLSASIGTEASITDTTSLETSAAASASNGNQVVTSADEIPTLSKELPSLAWHLLRYLNLSSNNLTFVPVEPLLCLSGLTYLDLSSNLLNVVPPSLSHLPALTSLNISDNLIDSVLGIYDTLPAIRVLNLAKNRLESLCGLERLYTLQRVDLRGNAIYESGEVGRLAPLPAIAEVWVKHNPLMEELVDYRVDCFVEFAQEGRSVVLDGEAPGFFEKQRIVERVPNAAALYSQTDAAGSRMFNAWTSGGGKDTKKAAEVVEENEAQIAHNAATTSRKVTMVKTCHQRAAAPRSANAETGRDSSEIIDVRGKGKSKAAGGSPPRSKSPESSRVQSGAARRRNQRVVELDRSPQKPQRERTLTESDRIKQAALAGNSSAAMESPDSSATPCAGKGAEATGSPSPLNGNKMTWSKKTGVSAAQVAVQDSRSRSGHDFAEHKDEISKEEALAVHGTKLFALPPNTEETQTSPSRATRTFTTRRNPIDTSTLGRKSAARRVACDLFSPPSSEDPVAGEQKKENENTNAAAGDEDQSADIVRQRIARPRQGSSAALARRSRVTMSLYEPDLDPAEAQPASPSKPPKETLAKTPIPEDTSIVEGPSKGDAFRKRIEALKSEVGDDWLRILARGGRTAGDRNSSVLLSRVTEAESEVAEGGSPNIPKREKSNKKE